MIKRWLTAHLKRILKLNNTKKEIFKIPFTLNFFVCGILDKNRIFLTFQV